MYDKLVDALTKKNVWIYILHMLKDHPMYGHEIAKEIKRRYNFSVATVTVYTTLYKLEREGLICKVSGESRRWLRTYYKLTPKGAQELERGLNFIKEVWSLLSG